MNRSFPRCIQKRADCEFCKNRCCIILKSTDFDRACPFYKKRSEIETAVAIDGVSCEPIEIRKGAGDVVWGYKM